MDSTLSTRLMQNIRIQVPGALDDVMQLEMFNVALDFCDQTDVWRQDLPIKVVANRTSYDLTADAEVTRLILLADENNVPVAATLDVPDTLVLVNTPSAAHTWTATVALKPDSVDSDGYPDIPDWITSKYLLTIIEGVVYRLMSQPSKPYSNSTMAAYHMRKFRDGCATARAQAQKSNLYGGQAWRFPQWTQRR